jgi:hypothetical protein
VDAPIDAKSNNTAKIMDSSTNVKLDIGAIPSSDDPQLYVHCLASNKRKNHEEH